MGMSWRIRISIAPSIRGQPLWRLSHQSWSTSKTHLRLISGVSKVGQPQQPSKIRILSRSSKAIPCSTDVGEKPNVCIAAVPNVILACGQNICGQLGLATSIIERRKPQHVRVENASSNLAERIQSVCAGAMHSCALTIDGLVFTWGCNDDGALGRPTADIDDEYMPKLCTLSEEITNLCAGDTFTVALGRSGRAYITGCFRSSDGLLGLLTPKQVVQQAIAIPLGRDVKQIACGADFCLLLADDGELFSFGNNEAGQLGRATNGNLDEQHAEWLRPSPIQFFQGQHILQIWAGGHGFFVLAKDIRTRLFSCGANSFGQLGHPAKARIDSPLEIADFLPTGSIVKIACGLQHTLLLDAAGCVYGLGRGDDGRLGSEHARDLFRPNRIDHLANVIDIAAGGSVSFAIDKRGQAFSFGMGDTCQTGHGDEDIFVPTLVKGKQLEQRRIRQISVGAQHTLFLAEEHH